MRPSWSLYDNQKATHTCKVYGKGDFVLKIGPSTGDTDDGIVDVLYIFRAFSMVEVVECRLLSRYWLNKYFYFNKSTSISGYDSVKFGDRLISLSTK